MAAGGTGSYYTAYSQLKTSLNATFGTAIPVAEQTNSGGSPVGAGERNVTWLAINSGSLASSTPQYMQVILGMLGTKIYKRRPGSGDELAMNPVFTQVVEVKDLAGYWYESSKNLTVWDCGTDITQPCLEPTGDVISGFKPLARLAYESMKTIRDAIVNRQDVLTVTGGVEAMQMMGLTRLPAYKILELTSSGGMTGLSEIMMQKYANLIGWELATQFILQLTEDVAKQISDSKATASSGFAQADLDFLEKRLTGLNMEASAIRNELAVINGSQADLINEIQMMERSFYNSFNLRLMDNLKMAQRR